MNSKEEILFVPSGEIITIPLFSLGVLVGTNKNDHVRSDEKVNVKKINGYWTIEDKNRHNFIRIMNWTNMNS